MTESTTFSATNETDRANPARGLRLFWWVFALRGGFALLFSGVLFYVGHLLGTVVLDPAVLVTMALLLGFYVLGNALLQGIAAGFAAEHHLHLWPVLAAECCFAVALGIYIGVALIVSTETMALLAGILTLGNACFQAALAFKLRHDRGFLLLLGLSGLASLAAGVAFLMNLEANIFTTTQWLSVYELFNGVMIIIFASGLRRAVLPAQ
jgi:uncharacterized membrane protein HdeD (DUF308 family)